MQKHISSIHLKVGYQKLIEGWVFFLFIGNTILFRNVAAGGKPSENQYENKKKMILRFSP